MRGRSRRAPPAARVAEPPQAVADRALRHFLQLRHERRPHRPVRRMVAAEPIAELLPQELLRVAGARIGRARIRADPDARPARGLLLRGGDEPFFAHPRQHDVAARRPRRRGSSTATARTARGPGRRSARTPRSVSCLAGLPNRCLRHRLDAVDAGAEVDAIQVQLEDLLLRQLRVDHQREHRFVHLAAVGLLVRQEQRARELLRQRAAALERSRIAQVADDRPRRARSDRRPSGCRTDGPRSR